MLHIITPFVIEIPYYHVRSRTLEFLDCLSKSREPIVYLNPHHVRTKKILTDRKYLVSFKSYAISSDSSVQQRQGNGKLRQRIPFKLPTILYNVVQASVSIRLSWHGREVSGLDKHSRMASECDVTLERYRIYISFKCSF